MRQAKQQSQDLHQTDDFLTTIMKPGYLEKEKVKPPPETNSFRQVNGRPKMPRVDSFSRFSDPPAPPPQQPLPEKPDALPRNGLEGMSPLRRSDTEKPKPPSANSPVSRESSQILSLIEALSSAKRELDSQGARVKELETLLFQERTARESAEEKARGLEIRSIDQGQQSEVVAAFEPPLDNDQESAAAQRTLEKPVDSNSISPSPTIIPSEAPVSADIHTKQLEHRLETMVVEMEEMRKQVAAFKDHAHKAEDETVKTRKSLAEMIEALRLERTEDGEVVDSKLARRVHDSVAARDAPTCQEDHNVKDFPLGHTDVSPQTKGADDAATTLAGQQRKQSFVEQSSPYASMIGVVLLGVGLMAYLNGWQKMDS